MSGKIARVALSTYMGHCDPSGMEDVEAHNSDGRPTWSEGQYAMDATKDVSRHGAPPAAKPKRDNWHADHSERPAGRGWSFLLAPFPAVVKQKARRY
jgi:hypothetical protein